MVIDNVDVPHFVLRLSNVHFARSERAVVSEIHWSVEPHQIAAVLGANGCGKSTLLRIAAGYLWPQRGQVELLGHTLGEYPVAPLRARIGIVEATTIYPFDDGMTAREVVVSGYFSALTLGYLDPSPQQFAHAQILLEQVGLGRLSPQLYATLSTGERLRCLLARALVRQPELLLLDEPTAGLDLPAREAVLATLSGLHRRTPSPAIVTVTHHLEELLPETDNILLLSREGHVVACGKPAKVLTDAHLSHAYGIPIQVTRNHDRYHAHVDPGAWGDLLI